MFIQANSLQIPLRQNSVQCCVTSPPYWGLRDYGTAKWDGGDKGCDHVERMARQDTERETPGGRGGSFRGGTIGFSNDCRKCGARRIDNQLGLEKTPDEYVAKMVEVFREVWRVLRDDGTAWVNLGDSYASASAGNFGSGSKPGQGGAYRTNKPKMDYGNSIKFKNLVGIPWRVAFALQADGWYLRSDIIWSKPNPMPESVTDRPTKSHEYVFLLAKSERYFFDQDAVRSPFNYPDRVYSPDTSNHKTARLSEQGNRCTAALHDGRAKYGDANKGRNIRTVWTISTQPYPEAHFATFPEALVKPCVLAGCPVGGIVFDPFVDSGTTVKVAQDLGRIGIGMDLSAEYLKLAWRRSGQQGLKI